MRRLLASALVACGHAPPPAPACPAELVVAGRADVARFGGCASAGKVVIRTGARLDVSSLRRLQSIAGDLVIGPTVGIEEVQLVELRAIGGALRVSSNSSLRGLYLPKLERVGRIEIDGNVALVTVALPRLAAVDSAVAITDNTDLEIVDAPALASIGSGLVIAGHPNLTLVELPNLARVGTVRIEGSPKLPADIVEQLRGRAAP